jgi:hypothetical protein
MKKGLGILRPLLFLAGTIPLFERDNLPALTGGTF